MEEKQKITRRHQKTKTNTNQRKQKLNMDPMATIKSDSQTTK
jgi:hypothetical protein